MIYFIRNGEFIKIGRADYPKERLNQLQIGNPMPLELIATIPGGRSEERTLHDRFAAYGVGGEWFRDCDEIRAFIESPKPIRVPKERRPPPPLTTADLSEILASVLGMAVDMGLMVGVRDAPATERRSDGIMIYVSGLRTENGAIVAQPAPEVVQS